MKEYETFKNKFANLEYDYCEPLLKGAMHRAGKAFLKKLAESLGLQKNQFDIRSNMGGIAVAGEITLHAENIYIQICESHTRTGMQILIRKCKGRKDFSGGQNNYFQFFDGDYSCLIKKIGYIVSLH